MSAPSPLSIASRRPAAPSSVFRHERLPGVTLTPTADNIVLSLKTDADEALAQLSPQQARSLASALYAFAELIEPKREPRGSGWRPS